MKKITFLLLFISTVIFSQTIQMPNIPEDGVTYETARTDFFLSDPTSNGPWDYSFINISDVRYVSLQSIEDSDFSPSVYPNSTHVKYAPDVVQFPGFTESGYTYNGENSIINAIYPTPLTLIPYPFSVGETHEDQVINIPFTCPVCPPSMYRAHSVSTEALGSGSITLPGDVVFDNVVLIQQVAIFNDGQTGSATCNTTRTSFFWWSQEHGIPLLETYSQVTSGACSFPSVTFTRVFLDALPFDNNGPGCDNVYTLPYLNDFNDADSFGCMINIDSDGDGYSWNNVQFDIDAAGNGVADSQSWDGTALNPDNWLIMGPIDMTNVDDATLSWKVRGIDPDWCSENYTIYISESSDPATLSSSNLYYNETIAGGSDACGNLFAERAFDISSAVGGQIYIGIRHHNISDMFRLNIDDVAVDSNSLSTNDFNILDVSIYPNPVDGNFVTIQSLTNGLKEIQVFDILGKRVINTTLSSDSLDISELNPGVYMVKVTVENQSKVSKLIIK